MAAIASVGRLFGTSGSAARIIDSSADDDENLRRVEALWQYAGLSSAP
jgi:hypothetical protein